MDDDIPLRDLAGEDDETVVKKAKYTFYSEEMLEFLIIEVQAHEAIWNRASKLYKIPQQSKAAWSAVAINLGQDCK